MWAQLTKYLTSLTGKPVRAKLPQRVLDTIRAQQEDSEILVGWLQLGAVFVFGLLYTVAPKTFSEDVAFEPVPWVLLVYFIFTVIRLGLAHQRRMPHWLIYLSVVADMVLLLGLIWSFHLQYEQPASFYLKAPTLLYVFIFIALRALHFEVRFIALSGIVAAIGWSLMVLYVITIDPNDPMITRNYVEYMTSNSVLLGAEFDKIISIIMVTLILSVAIARARQLLIRSVVESSAAHELARFVPDQVVRQVANAEELAAPGQGQVSDATILFIDIEQFTTIGETLTPQQLITTLNEYFAAVAESIETRGGVINQFQGDAILASFNLPEATTDHALKGVEAALEIHQTLADRRFGDDLQLKARIGVNSGQVVGGLVGTGKRLSYTVHGDDVNLAARLEQLNKQEGTRILVSETTVDLIGADRFPFRRIGEVTVRGKHKSAVVYALDVAY